MFTDFLLVWTRWSVNARIITTKTALQWCNAANDVRRAVYTCNNSIWWWPLQCFLHIRNKMCFFVDFLFIKTKFGERWEKNSDCTQIKAWKTIASRKELEATMEMPITWLRRGKFLSIYFFLFQITSFSSFHSVPYGNRVRRTASTVNISTNCLC